MMAYEESESTRDNFGKFIYQFQPETKTLIRKFERILNKLYIVICTMPSLEWHKAIKCTQLYFNQDGVIFTLNRKPLKSVDQFIYLGSYISSTESDINIDIGKSWTAIDRFNDHREV